MGPRRGTSEKQNVMGDLDLVCFVVLSDSTAQFSFW